MAEILFRPFWLLSLFFVPIGNQISLTEINIQVARQFCEIKATAEEYCFA